MWIQSAGFILGITLANLAIAENSCINNPFYSHAEELTCEAKLSQQRLQDVNKAFAELMAANEHANHYIEHLNHNGGNTDEYADDLRSDQSQWRAFIAKDCALQGAVGRSNAGGDIEQQCLQDAYVHRIQVFHQMSQLLVLDYQ